MLAGTCPKCRSQQETEAPPGDGGRPRLTAKQSCTKPGCDGMVSFRRQPRAAPEPRQQTEPPRRNVRKYRTDATPHDPEPQHADEPGADPGPGPGRPAGLVDDSAAAEPGQQPPRRRRYGRVLTEHGSLIPGIY